jgi:hypothetical protein
MKKLYAGVFMVIMMGALLLPGCADLNKAMNGGGQDTKQAQAQPRYLDFGDVLIPGELNKDAKESYIVNNSHGMLMLKGRVYADSLAQFFITSMNTDGWALLNQYKYQGKIKIFFKKSERFCSILITENPLATWVEIWVVPQEKI